MIVSKPKVTAVFSLTVFIIICLSVAYVGLNNMIESGEWRWYNYLTVYGFGPLAFILSLRVLFNYKIVSVGKGRVEVWYPFRLTKKKFKAVEMESWKEDIVKTGKTKFRQLKISFSGFTVKLSNQENSSYPKIYGYLDNRFKKKRTNA